MNMKSKSLTFLVLGSDSRLRLSSIGWLVKAAFFLAQLVLPTSMASLTSFLLEWLVLECTVTASTSVWPTTAPSSDIRSIEFDCPEVATEGDFTDTRGTCKFKEMSFWSILKMLEIY